MQIKLKEAADLIGGKIFGSKNLVIKNLAKIEEAASGDLTFLYHPAYQKYFSTTKATAILVKPGFDKSRDDIAYIEVDDPGKAFSKLLIHYCSPEFPLKGIDSTAFIHPDAVIGDNVALGKNVVISKNCRIGNNVKIFHNTVLLEDVQIGDDSLIFQNVSIREKCIIGKRAIIHPGTVIGADGFGFFPDETGIYNKIPQIGNVVIEDDVELGANVTIDRAALGSTVIKKGVKIDNLVQVAHNVLVGENTVISAQTGISGSTKIGKNCILAGQSGLVGHIEIADGVIVMAQSGVSKSITKPGAYFGSPSKEHKAALKQEAHLRNLSEYAGRIKQVEVQLKRLEEELEKLRTHSNHS
jgi:UDP-3-O-[3-hydroxymyristoyl] glucosamine N-acyltransferase